MTCRLPAVAIMILRELGVYRHWGQKGCGCFTDDRCHRCLLTALRGWRRASFARTQGVRMSARRN